MLEQKIVEIEVILSFETFMRHSNRSRASNNFIAKKNRWRKSMQVVSAQKSNNQNLVMQVTHPPSNLIQILYIVCKQYAATSNGPQSKQQQLAFLLLSIAA